MTSLLRKPEAKGSVRFDRDAEDARSKRVVLTGAGPAARAEALAAWLPALTDLPEGFPPALAREILPTLERLRIWLDTRR